MMDKKIVFISFLYNYCFEFVAILLFLTLITSCEIAKPVHLTQEPTKNNILPTPKLSDRPTLAPEDKYLIKLTSREFIPNEDIQANFLWLREQQLERVHVILQTYEIPGTKEKSIIQDQEIILLNYLPSLAWFASIPTSLQENSPVVELIRWFGPILPEDKIYEGILKENVGNWAITNNKNYLLQVTFFTDTKKEENENILIFHNAEIIDFSNLTDKFSIEISPNHAIPLAKEDNVRWIDIIPPPPIIDEQGE